MTLLTTPMFNFHWIISALTTPTPTPSLEVKTSQCVNKRRRQKKRMRSIDGIPEEECANVLCQIIFRPVLSNQYLAIANYERQNEWFVEFIPIILILRPAVHGVCFGLQVVGRGYGIFRACLHGGGRPQVGEVTRVGGVTRLSTWSLILIWSRLHYRWGDPQAVTSPTRGPPPPCKQALRLVQRPSRFIFRYAV